VPNGSKFVEIVCQQRADPARDDRHHHDGAVAPGVGTVRLAGDEAFPILVLDFVLIGLSLLFFGGTYWYCIRRSMDE